MEKHHHLKIKQKFILWKKTHLNYYNKIKINISRKILFSYVLAINDSLVLLTTTNIGILCLLLWFSLLFFFNTYSICYSYRQWAVRMHRSCYWSSNSFTASLVGKKQLCLLSVSTCLYHHLCMGVQYFTEWKGNY